MKSSQGKCEDLSSIPRIHIKQNKENNNNNNKNKQKNQSSAHL